MQNWENQLKIVVESNRLYFLYCHSIIIIPIAHSAEVKTSRTN